MRRFKSQIMNSVGPLNIIGLLCILLVGGLMGAACNTPTEMKLGALGEYCAHGDSDCRPGLICEDNVCSHIVVDSKISCPAICERLDACDSQESNCLTRCNGTIAGWGQDAIRIFGECLISGLSCEDARKATAYQVCYEQIPLDSERNKVCEDLLDFVATCYPESPRDVREDVLRQCRVLARTASNTIWKATDACIDAMDREQCDEQVDCLNDLFDPELPLPGTTIN